MTTRPTIGSAELDSVLECRKAVKELRDKIFQEGVHMRILVEGRPPALLKPGAELIAQRLGLRPTYRPFYSPPVDVPTGSPAGHRLFDIVCTLTRDGVVIAEGIGSSSTLESRYRYREERVSQHIPQEYWATRDPNLIGGPGHSVIRKGGRWVVVARVEKGDPADDVNSAIKMAKKRAFIDAVQTAAACSDLFSQLGDLEEDLEEDLPQEAKAASASASASAPSSVPAPASASGRRGPTPVSGARTAKSTAVPDATSSSRTLPQRIYGLLGSLGFSSDDEKKRAVRALLPGYASSKDVPVALLQSLLDALLKVRKEEGFGLSFDDKGLPLIVDLETGGLVFPRPPTNQNATSVSQAEAKASPPAPASSPTPVPAHENAPTTDEF